MWPQPRHSARGLAGLGWCSSWQRLVFHQCSALKSRRIHPLFLWKQDFHSNSRILPGSKAGLDLSDSNILYPKIELRLLIEFLQWLWLCRQQTQRSLAWGTRWTRRARWHGVYTLMGNKTKKQLSEPQCISPVLARAATDGDRRACTTKCVSESGSAKVWE